MNPNKEVNKTSCQVTEETIVSVHLRVTCECVGDIKDWIDLGTKG